MFAKRLTVALLVLMLLVGCGSNPTRDDSSPGPQGTPQSSPTGPGSNPSDGSSDADTKTNSHGGGGGGFNIPDIPGNGDALLAIVGIIVVLVAAQGVIWTVDYIKKHSTPNLEGSVKDGVYHAKHGEFSVAVPGDYPAHEGTGFKVREVRDQGQEQVVFLPATDGDPLYGVSVQPRLSAADAVMSLDDYASKLYPSPTQDGRPVKPALDEKLTLDGKPALFREYMQIPSIGAEPVYYLLYFIKTGDRSALVSITWTSDCSKCAAGPEADIRAMDPHLRQFVESFHLADAAPAN